MKVAILLLLFASMLVKASDPAPFEWPAGVSNRGPYTATAVVSNYFVLRPDNNVSLENDLATHKYHHHTQVSYQQGTIFVAFSSACTNEADGGMQTAMCVSKDKGVTWGAPILMMPSQSDWNNLGFIDGCWITYPRCFVLYNGTNYLTMAVDQIMTMVADGNPHEHGIGLFARAVYPNGSVGPLFRISVADYTANGGRDKPAYDDTLGPVLYAQSKVYGTWGGSWPQDSHTNGSSDWVGWIYLNSSHGYVEPVTFSSDGTTNNLYRLWRGTDGGTCISNVNFSFSVDAGASWSTITNSNIPNDPSETCGTRLTDGRFVIIGNPNNKGGGFTRNPLFLAITDVGSTTITNVSSIRDNIGNTPVFPVPSHAGGAQYPGVCQVGNYLYVSYSISKEDVGFSRVLIPGLENNDDDTWPKYLSKIGILNLR